MDTPPAIPVESVLWYRIFPLSGPFAASGPKTNSSGSGFATAPSPFRPGSGDDDDGNVSVHGHGA